MSHNAFTEIYCSKNVVDYSPLSSKAYAVMNLLVFGVPQGSCVCCNRQIWQSLWDSLCIKINANHLVLSMSTYVHDGGRLL